MFKTRQMKLLLSVLLLSLFLVAGIQKATNFNSSVSGFMKQTSLSLQISQIAIIIAILIEILGPLIVWYEALMNKSTYSNLALYSLIVFTVLASIIYHKSDFSGALKNTSVVAGMILLSKQ